MNDGPATVPSAPAPTAPAARPRGPASTRRADPVIVLSYPYGGGRRLRSLLARAPELACTSGTGILPLCAHAALTWQQAEGNGGPPSALALASVRALAGNLITVLLARAGRPRWCETATAPPEYAELFLCAFPGTRFLCLYRDCASVIRSAVRAHPWGLADPGFAPFTTAYPGHSVAAIAAYWAEHTESVLEFEASHPGASHRIRYEDLAPGGGVPGELAGFLELAGERLTVPGWLSEDPPAAAEGDAAAPDDQEARIPAEQIPPPLLSRVNALLARLSYTPITRW